MNSPEINITQETLDAIRKGQEEFHKTVVAACKLQPTICVDFDGTLCDFAFPGIGKPKHGAKEALAGFRRAGYKVMIYSCRASHWHYDVFGGDPSQPTLERQTVKDMIAWLDEHGIEYDEVDDGSRGKPLAALYVDDKGMRFDNNWPQVAAWVFTRKPL